MRFPYDIFSSVIWNEPKIRLNEMWPQFVFLIQIILGKSELVQKVKACENEFTHRAKVLNPKGPKDSLPQTRESFGLICHRKVFNLAPERDSFWCAFLKLILAVRQILSSTNDTNIVIS